MILPHAPKTLVLLLFALDKLDVRHNSTSGLVIQKVSHDAHLAMKVSTKFEVDTTIHCRVIALLLLIRYVTLDLHQWSYMADHVVNPSTKFEDPTAIRSGVMSSDISHRIPLTMRLQPLCMRRIT